MSPLIKLLLLTAVFTVLVIVVYVLVVRAFYWSGREEKEKNKKFVKK
jgi:hypothetical protein